MAALRMVHDITFVISSEYSDVLHVNLRQPSEENSVSKHEINGIRSGNVTIYHLGMEKESFCIEGFIASSDCLTLYPTYFYINFGYDKDMAKSDLIKFKEDFGEFDFYMTDDFSYATNSLSGYGEQASTLIIIRINKLIDD